MKRLLCTLLFPAALFGMAQSNPLFTATTKKEVNTALYQGYPINTIDASGKTPLITTALLQRPEAFFALIQAGADVLATDARDWSAFDYIHECAIITQKQDPPYLIHMMAYLIERGAPVTAQSPFNTQILCKAASYGYANAVKALIEAGTPVNAYDVYGKTALHYAATFLTSSEYKVHNERKLEIIRYLVGKGADINLCAQDGQSALTYAIQSSFLPCITLLLSIPELNVLIGRLPTEEIPTGIPPFAAMVDLHYNSWWTTKRTWREMCELLVRHPSFQPLSDTEVVKSIEYGRAVNTKDAAAKTALMHAVLSGNIPSFLALIQANADVTLTDNQGSTAYDYAQREAVAAHEPGPYLVMMARLIDKGAHFNPASQFNPVICILSAQLGYFETVKKMIDTGHMNDDIKDSALHNAVMRLNDDKEVNENKLRIVRYLLDNGVHINRMTEQGNTAFTIALETDFKPMMKLLLEQKNLNVKIGVTSVNQDIYHAALDEYDNTWFANRIGWWEIVQLIEKHPSFVRQEQ